MDHATDTDPHDRDVDDRFERLHRFHGGLVLPGQHEMSTSLPIKDAGIPPVLVIPLLQHIGETAECLVKEGDHVHKGQIIAAPRGSVSAPVHASSSGTVVAVAERPFPHPSGFSFPSVVIETDGRDEWAEHNYTLPDYRQLSRVRLLDHIRAAGIVGLGGAGFPTQVKLSKGPSNRVDLLVINGVECEPYISCDNMLLQERARDVLEGVRVLQHILQPRDCVIAIEADMREAEAAMREAASTAEDTGIKIVSVPERYPSGGERQLIKVLTGREVPSQGFPSDIGIICQNVGTTAAVYRAVVNNRPLVSRIVTVTGAGVKQPRNLEVLIGTPFRYAIEACGGYSDDVDRLLMGGPMMGFAVNTDEIPVIKATNCILAVTRTEMPPPAAALPCIRCGKCTEVCPADLLPQQLYWYARSGNLDAAQDYSLFDCIECGCCAYVCPSHIPLVQYYRHAKTEIWDAEKQKKASDIARDRHQSRQARLEHIKRERAERLARKKRAVSGTGDARDDAKKAAIQAALERVRMKKEREGIAQKNVNNLTPEQAEKIREVETRRQHKRPPGEH
jgi:electron transport complex protein RnfC